MTEQKNIPTLSQAYVVIATTFQDTLALIDEQVQQYNPQLRRYVVIDQEKMIMQHALAGTAIDEWTSNRNRVSLLKNALYEKAREQQIRICNDGIQFDKEIITFTDDKITVLPATKGMHTPVYFPRVYQRNTLVGVPQRISILIDQWVGEIQREQLLDVLAFCFSPRYEPQKVVIFNGGGGNGKSTFLQLIERLVGKKNTISVTLENIGKENYVAELYNKNVAFISETIVDYHTTWTESIKRLTGNDLISARRLYSHPFSFKNNAKILIATNAVPLQEDLSDGFSRRFTIIDFNNQFLRSEKNPVEELTNQELDDFASYLITRLPSLWKKKHFGTTYRTLQEERERYDGISNPLPRFINECAITEPEGSGGQERIILGLDQYGDPEFLWYRENYSRAYKEYKSWLHKRGLRIVSRKEFKRALEHTGYEVAKIRIRPAQDARWGIDGFILKSSVPSDILQNYLRDEIK